MENLNLTVERQGGEVRLTFRLTPKNTIGVILSPHEAAELRDRLYALLIAERKGEGNGHDCNR